MKQNWVIGDMNKQQQPDDGAGEKLKRQILFPLGAMFLLLLAAFSAFIYHNERAHLDESFRNELASTQASYHEIITLKGNNLRAALGFLEHDQALHAALAAGDRDRLQTLFTPLFEQLKRELNITHFYFLDARRATLLRLHQPPRFGDRIERITAREAERTGHTAIGTELGALGTITLRAVKPLREGGRIIGYVELGIEVLDIAENLNRNFRNEIFVHLHKAYLSREEWEEGMRMLGRKAEWDRYPDFILASKTSSDISPELERIYAQGKYSYEMSNTDLKQGDQTYRLGFIPLNDVSGRNVGEFSILHNTTATTAQTRRLLSTFIGVAAGSAALLFIMIYLILGRTQRALATYLAERKQNEEVLRQSEERLHTLYDSTSDAVMLLDEKGFIDCNRAALQMFGCATKEMFCSKHPADLSPPEQPCGTDSMTLANRKMATAKEDGCNFFEWIHKRADNGLVFSADVLLNRMELDGKTVLQATVRDITERKLSEANINNLAFYDTLTELPNRRLMLDRLHQALAINARTGQQGALLFIDLDHFRSINDTKGHAVGDLLLVEVAKRLQNCTREGDTTARVGGDEFVVLLESLDTDEQLAANHVKTVGEKILEILRQPYTIEGSEYHSTASIGLTLFRGQVKTMEEMLKRADVALYQAKSNGRNTLRFFDPAMQAAVTTRVALESDLRRAVSEQTQFELYYQAQVDSTGRVIGAEALLRWQHPERGLVSPAKFIPLAEETGLILPLGHWVLTTACQQLADWAARPETAHLIVAVNVSAKQFNLPTFVEEVLALVDYFKVNPARLKLEITESLMMNNVDEIIDKMAILKSRGINFPMDDFGTGYSSLSYLKRLPLYQLKIDQSFVRDVLTDSNDAAIARIIVNLAQSMNLEVIAEGVETEEQRNFLEENGCHVFQGYLFSKPVPVEQFEMLLKRGPF